MTTDTDPAIVHLAESLASALAAESSSELRGYLTGRKLPAMGGDLRPADVLRRAIPLTGEASTILPRLARLLATVITEEVEGIAYDRQALPVRRRYLLLDALDLATDLPAEDHLFASLRALFQELGEMDEETVRSLRLPLLQSLVYQQTDASLESEWLAILRASNEEWTPARRTLLLTAWRGLLWIPPATERQQNGEIVDFERIERGLQDLYRATENRTEGKPFLEMCLDVLSETYPRSAEFWGVHFQPYVRLWPKDLADIVLEKWPLALVDPEQKAPLESREEIAELLERMSAAFAAFDSSMEVLRAAANAAVANYENRHLGEALDTIAEAFRIQHDFAFIEAAAQLNQNIVSINQQMNMLRSWQELERQVHADLQKAEEFLRRYEDTESQIQRGLKAG
jgi:hypothetical protein